MFFFSRYACAGLLARCPTHLSLRICSFIIHCFAIPQTGGVDTCEAAEEEDDGTDSSETSDEEDEVSAAAAKRKVQEGGGERERRARARTPGREIR